MNTHDHHAHDPIDPAILQEAADWLMRLHETHATSDEQEALQRWCSLSPAHGRAWQRAEVLLGDLKSLPPAPARSALTRPNLRRRQILRLLWLPAAAPVGWLAWRNMVEEGERWHTATGQQRTLVLADGTQVQLDTATRIVVQFDDATRRIRLLSGEILVTSAPAVRHVPRPLVVSTPKGNARAIGTRFTVRHIDGDSASTVAVFEGAVEVSSAHALRHLESGHSTRFGQGRIQDSEPIHDTAGPAWTNGMIIARNMRLADLVAELNRYRPGLLRCHPKVAELRVSGTFPALEPDRSLDLLAASFPLRIQSRTRYWVTVEPG